MIHDRNLRFLAVLSMVAVFAAGLGIGLAIDRLLGRATQQQQHPPQPGPPLEHLLHRFSSELALSDAQQQSIQEILKGGRGRAEQIMARARPELEAIRVDMESRIDAQLDATQREKYREMIKQPPGPPPGPHPGHPPGPPHGAPPPGHGPPGIHPPPPVPPGAPPPN